MSKKLDEIKESLEGQEYYHDLVKLVDRVWIASRDECAEWAAKNAKGYVTLAEDSREAFIDKKSILAAKTEPTLQP